MPRSIALAKRQRPALASGLAHLHYFILVLLDSLYPLVATVLPRLVCCLGERLAELGAGNEGTIKECGMRQKNRQVG